MAGEGGDSNKCTILPARRCGVRLRGAWDGEADGDQHCEGEHGAGAVSGGASVCIAAWQAVELSHRH